MIKLERKSLKEVRISIDEMGKVYFYNNRVLRVINEDSIKTIPGTNETRIFKGFLYAFLTQNPPKQIGLLGGMPNQDQQNLNIGF